MVWHRRLPRWLLLLLMLRAAAAGTAVTLLALHRATDHDGLLAVIVVVYSVLSAAAVARSRDLLRNPLAWAVDIGVMYALIWVSGDWRSPFYLLGLTALAIPAATLGARGGVLLGAGYTLAYAVAAHTIGPDPLHLGTQASIETLVTHLVLPGITCFAVGYSAETLRDLADQRRRAERLSIEAERRRIAWELHDSAKQRVHAAHLLVSSLSGVVEAPADTLVSQALSELQAASAEMDTSLAELQEPLMGRPLDVVLRERAQQLGVPGGPVITVQGRLPQLSPLQAAHSYRIASEALTNAVRHAGASHIAVRLEPGPQLATLLVADDGGGMPERPRPGSTGLLSMRSRARSIGARLDIERNGVTGTIVRLVVPVGDAAEDPA